MNAKKRMKFFRRRKKKSSFRKDISYVDYKHYADLKSVTEEITPMDKKSMKKMNHLIRFKKN